MQTRSEVDGKAVEHANGRANGTPRPAPARSNGVTAERSELEKLEAALTAAAREAEVSAALERVRQQALAMRHSDHFSGVAASVFRELKGLGLEVMRLGIALVEEDADRFALWIATTHDGEDAAQVVGHMPMTGHPLLEGNADYWRHQHETTDIGYSFVLVGEDITEYYRVLVQGGLRIPGATSLPTFGPEDRHYFFSSAFPAGGLYAFRPAPFSPEAKLLMHRMSKAFHFAYTRFEELQLAEGRAREAEKQAALDRVRAEIASMRSAADLGAITPLIWHELMNLGLSFFRCGVFIMDEERELSQVHLTTPDGSPLAALELPYDCSEMTLRAVEHWRRGEVYTDLWDQGDFEDWVRTLTDLGLLSEAGRYRGNAPPPESLALHFAPFEQGMLYVGGDEPLSPEASASVQALAEAFAVAYARYTDFRELEDKNKEIEAAMAKLQAMQAQIIQSEKLASLGQLTAGIAHEIKNPLNFVTNFASLSTELVRELESEADPSVKEAILQDLQRNAAKIEEHGRRADSIVNAMMTHARKSAGVRARVIVNALVEEYVHLAWHGLPRGRDAVRLVQAYEPEAGEIDAVGEDLGRVVINLVANAYHAVTQRASGAEPGYTPEVAIRTGRRASEDGERVEIVVEDNGSGMPPAVAERVFEPFFTTKPAGEGTGLGLSMSYDIVVHGHGGALDVESTEGAGTRFVIALPAT